MCNVFRAAALHCVGPGDTLCEVAGVHFAEYTCPKNGLTQPHSVGQIGARLDGFPIAGVCVCVSMVTPENRGIWASGSVDWDR